MSIPEEKLNIPGKFVLGVDLFLNLTLIFYFHNYFTFCLFYNKIKMEIIKGILDVVLVIFLLIYIKDTNNDMQELEERIEKLEKEKSKWR